MEILLNGEPHQAPDGSTIADLVEGLGLTGKRLAVEVNLDVVPRTEHASVRLQAGDRVEIVHAIGGGQSNQAQSGLAAGRAQRHPPPVAS